VPASKPDLPAPQGNGLPGPNNSPSPESSRLPQPHRLGNSAKAMLIVAAVVVVCGGRFLAVTLVKNAGGQRADILTHTVRPENLQLTVTERGQLESAVNRDVVCRVKARSTNSAAATTIKWLIEDGSQVKQGQLIIELDSSG